MKKVYVLFESYDGGDASLTGHTSLTGRASDCTIKYDMLGCFSSVGNAQEYIHKLGPIRADALLLTSMTRENDWTYIGKRDECGDSCSSGAVFCGFIIEEMEVI